MGCLLLLTGCAIDPEHFDGFNPVPGAARKDVAYSEMRALRGGAADRAEGPAAAQDAGPDALSWQACPPAQGVPSDLQCGRLTVAGPAGAVGPGAVLTVVRRPAADAAARHGVALVATGLAPAGGPLLLPPADDPVARTVNRTFDLVTAQARTVSDLEAVRSALGENTWSLIGSGSAADLVADYARTHPERTRAVVLNRPDGSPQTILAAGPAAEQTRVAARACSAGPAGSADRAGPGLLAVGDGACATTPLLVIAPAAAVAAKEATVKTGNGGRGAVLRTVTGNPDGQADLGAGPCTGAAVESFLLTLVLPADGGCA